MRHKHSALSVTDIPRIHMRLRDGMVVTVPTRQLEVCRCGAIRESDLEDTDGGPEGLPPTSDWYPAVEEHRPLSVSEAAERAGLTVGAIRQACQTGRLPAYKPSGGAYWLIDAQELREWMAGRIESRRESL